VVTVSDPHASVNKAPSDKSDGSVLPRSLSTASNKQFQGRGPSHTIDVSKFRLAYWPARVSSQKFALATNVLQSQRK